MIAVIALTVLRGLIVISRPAFAADSQRDTAVRVARIINVLSVSTGGPFLHLSVVLDSLSPNLVLHPSTRDFSPRPRTSSSRASAKLWTWTKLFAFYAPSGPSIDHESFLNLTTKPIGVSGDWSTVDEAGPQVPYLRPVKCSMEL